MVCGKLPEKRERKEDEAIAFRGLPISLDLKEKVKNIFVNISPDGHNQNPRETEEKILVEEFIDE
ncbi:unnamed protein product, partial [Citrullus colocynthis]